MKKFHRGKKGVILLLFMVFGFISHRVEASSRFAIAPKISTLGFGGEGVFQIWDSLDFRAGINTFQYDYNTTVEDMEYNFELEWLNFSFLLDWFPFDSGFRLSGGLVVNENGVNLQARPTIANDYLWVGDNEYTSEEIGTINGSIDFNRVAPYIGLGWGRPFVEDGNWSVSLDLGVLFQGVPEAKVYSNGTLDSEALKADLEKERQAVQDALDRLNFFPVISLGVTYRF